MKLVLVDEAGLEFPENPPASVVSHGETGHECHLPILHSEAPCQNELEHYSYCHTLAQHSGSCGFPESFPEVVVRICAVYTRS